MLTYREAKKELFGYFYTNWQNGLANGLPNSSPPISPITFIDNLDGTGETYSPIVLYRNIELSYKIQAGRHFARITMHNLHSPQRSLPGGRQNGGAVKFTTEGIGIVQLFFSKSTYSTAEEDFLVAIASEMFVGKSSSNIWFRNVTIKDKPPEEKHFRTDVDFQYRYDTHV